MLSVQDLYHLEMVVRTEADRIRFRNPETSLVSPEISPGQKAHIRNERRRAEDFDQVGNLISGMQADWPTIGPLLRDGFVMLRRQYEASREAELQSASKDDAA